MLSEAAFTDLRKNVRAVYLSTHKIWQNVADYFAMICLSKQATIAPV